MSYNYMKIWLKWFIPREVEDIKNNKDTLLANFRPLGLYQAKRSMTQYNLHDIHLSLTKASALMTNNKQ